VSTYKELKDKTTPGPWTRANSTQLMNPKYRLVADFSMDDNTVKPLRSGLTNAVNARLAEHCCHHFDALLEALRELLNEAEPRFDIIDMTDDEERAIEEAHAALAAAQEVK